MAESARRQDDLATPEVATRAVLLIVGCGLAFLVFMMGVLAIIYFKQVPGHLSTTPQAFPPPRLQPDDSMSQLDELNAKQRKRLGNYAWANSDHTLVAIPIARAVAIIAGRGAKAYDPIIAGAAPDVATPPPSPAPLATPSPKPLEAKP